MITGEGLLEANYPAVHAVGRAADPARAPRMIELMHGARTRGVDISTEIYPWDASSDVIRSVIFDPGWERRWGVTPHDLQSTSTGDRLTQAQFDALRTGTGEDGVLMHMNSEGISDKTVEVARRRGLDSPWPDSRPVPTAVRVARAGTPRRVAARPRA